MSSAYMQTCRQPNQLAPDNRQGKLPLPRAESGMIPAGRPVTLRPGTVSSTKYRFLIVVCEGNRVE